MRCLVQLRMKAAEMLKLGAGHSDTKRRSTVELCGTHGHREATRSHFAA